MQADQDGQGIDQVAESGVDRSDDQKPHQADAPYLFDQCRHY